jgi:hypothetical protein
MSDKSFLRIILAVTLVYATAVGFVLHNKTERESLIEKQQSQISQLQKTSDQNRKNYEMTKERLDSTLKTLREKDSELRKTRASRSRPLAPKPTLKAVPQKTSTIDMGSLNWAALRECENSGKYTSNPGDHYRGAYQFDRSTWDGVARRHLSTWIGRDPASAPPGVQDSFALWLYGERGAQPWPSCGKRL